MAVIVESEQPTLYTKLGGHEGILDFLKPFYEDIRQHEILGPIFNAKIHDWDRHLDKITEFWALQTGGPTKYNGGFAAAHLRIGAKEEHFQHWLALWEYNCKRQLPDDLSKQMIALAHEFANRLKRVIRTYSR